MVSNKEQTSLIWTMFIAQNSERKISKFCKLGSNQNDVTVGELIFDQDGYYTFLNFPTYPWQYVFCSSPIDENRDRFRFSVWDYESNLRRDFNPLDHISFEDKV